jgi:hypothetical protein
VIVIVVVTLIATVISTVVLVVMTVDDNSGVTTVISTVVAANTGSCSGIVMGKPVAKLASITLSVDQVDANIRGFGGEECLQKK